MSLVSKLSGRDARTRKRQQSQAADPYNPSNAFGGAMVQSGQQGAEDRNSLLDLLGNGQSRLAEYARGAVSSAMPAFQEQLQGVRESANRRGISTGDLGTTYEGDLASAFQKNLTDSISGQALGLYSQQLGAQQGLYGMDQNNYLDLISGQLDRKQSKQNAKKAQTGGLLGGLFSLGGALGGGYMAGRK